MDYQVKHRIIDKMQPRKFNNTLSVISVCLFILLTLILLGLGIRDLLWYRRNLRYVFVLCITGDSCWNIFSGPPFFLITESTASIRFWPAL